MKISKPLQSSGGLIDLPSSNNDTRVVLRQGEATFLSVRDKLLQAPLGRALRVGRFAALLEIGKQIAPVLDGLLQLPKPLGGSRRQPLRRVVEGEI